MAYIGLHKKSSDSMSRRIVQLAPRSRSLSAGKEGRHKIWAMPYLARPKSYRGDDVRGAHTGFLGMQPVAGFGRRWSPPGGWRFESSTPSKCSMLSAPWESLRFTRTDGFWIKAYMDTKPPPDNMLTDQEIAERMDRATTPAHAVAGSGNYYWRICDGFSGL